MGRIFNANFSPYTL